MLNTLHWKCPCGKSNEQHMLMEEYSSACWSVKVQFLESLWWSGPGSPQWLAHRMALFARSTRRFLGLLGSCGRATWFSTRLNTAGHREGGSAHSGPWPVHQRQKNSPGGLPEEQRAGGGGGSFGSLSSAWIRVWRGKASGERRLQSWSKPQASPLGSQEVSGSLQAGGETVLEGVFLASAFSSRPASCISVL